MASDNLMKEKFFVVECFAHLSKFSHDKLKELTEKEKEKSKQNASLLWSSFLHLLLTFNDLEKTFYSLIFLGSSNFGARILGKREDTLKARYNCLLAELRKIECVHKDSTSPYYLYKAVSFPGKSLSDPSFLNKDGDVLKSCTTLEQLASVVCEQLQHFVLARMNTISFYEQMPALNSNKNVSVEDLLKTISTTLEEFMLRVNHPVVECFRCTYKMECETVINLLKTQLHLQRCQYLDSLLSLQCASHNLATWGNLFCSRESKRSAFGSANQKATIPELYDWLNRFKSLLLSKFTLYFFDVLCQHGGNVSEVKMLMNKAPFDFYGRIVSFAKRLDAMLTMLILTDASNHEDAHKKLGYNLPCKILIENDKEKSVDRKSQHVDTSSLPEVDETSQHMLKSTSAADFHNNNVVMFSFPHEKSDKHLSHMSNVLNTRKQELEQQDKIIYSLDVKLQCISVMMRIEGPIYIVTILNRRHTKPDTHVSNFYTSLCADLRCSKLFTGIKSSAK